jgi:hypothetical protein
MSREVSRLDDKKESLQGRGVDDETSSNNRGVIVGREVYFPNAPCLPIIPRLP